MIPRSAPSVAAGVNDQFRLADTALRLAVERDDFVVVEVTLADDEEDGQELRRHSVVVAGTDADHARASVLMVDGRLRGRIVIIDFIPKSREQRGFGPKLEMQLDRETINREMAASGLQPAAVHTFLPEQYFVEYRVKQ